jgi:hypothetical protein
MDPNTRLTKAIDEVSRAVLIDMQTNLRDTPSPAVINAVDDVMLLMICVYPTEIRNANKEIRIRKNDLFGPGSPSTFLDEIMTAGNKRYGDAQAEDGTSPGGYIGTFYIACKVYARGTKCELGAQRIYAHQIPLGHMSTEFMPAYVKELKTTLGVAPRSEKKRLYAKYLDVRKLLESGVTQLGCNGFVSMPFRHQEHVGPKGILALQANLLQDKLGQVTAGTSHDREFQASVDDMLDAMMHTICCSFNEAVKDALDTDIHPAHLHGLGDLMDIKLALLQFCTGTQDGMSQRAKKFFIEGKMYRRGTDKKYAAQRMYSDDFRVYEMNTRDYSLHIAELRVLQTKVQGRRLVWVNELLLSVLAARDERYRRGL